MCFLSWHIHLLSFRFENVSGFLFLVGGGVSSRATMLITFRPHLQYVKWGEIFSDLLLNTEKEYNTGISRVTSKRKRLYRESDE